MDGVAGKVALVTGAARGQGRSHALRLAAEGADVVAVDICQDIGSVSYGGATKDDLAETAKSVEALDRRIVTVEADVRDAEAMQAAVAEGIAQLGQIDIVCANAGIMSLGPATSITPAIWAETIGINLTGVWNTCYAAIPHLIERGQGGSVILTSSIAGLKGVANAVHYVAAKHGVVGIMRGLSIELAPHNIRVNSIHPTTVNTPMVRNQPLYDMFRPDLASPKVDDTLDLFTAMNTLQIPWVEPEDISSGVLWLASDESRYVTGIALPIDAGCLLH